LWPVFIIQVLAGVSQARYTLYTVFMSDLVPYERRATAIGLQQLVVGIGMVVAPVLGGLVAEELGVRAIFAVAGLASALATLLFGLTSLSRGDPRGSDRRMT
jgi:MFS family permease